MAGRGPGVGGSWLGGGSVAGRGPGVGGSWSGGVCGWEGTGGRRLLVGGGGSVAGRGPGVGGSWLGGGYAFYIPVDRFFYSYTL